MSDSNPEASRAGSGIYRLGALFAVLYFVQGIGEPVAGLVAQPVRSILKSWGESPAAIASFAAAVSIPWALKPLYGLVSDFVPLWGYRRKSYLLATSILSVIGFGVLYVFRPAHGDHLWFLILLITPTFAIAFADVLVDALMVERGRATGTTGVLQSVQWTATYGATLLTGVLGGYLSQIGQEALGFLFCGALALATLYMTWRWVDERPHAARENFRSTMGSLKAAVRTPELLSVAAFLFLWSFDPLSTTVIYVHITDHMHLSEQFFGLTLSLLAVGCILGSATYGLYCRRVSMTVLAHASILLGAASQAVYWTMHGRTSAVVVHVLVGFAYMSASMIQLDLAARVCPPQVAATIFAVLMALTNVASSLAEWIGGTWYESLIGHLGGASAFAVMVGIGVALRFSCWILFAVRPGRRTVGWALPGEPAIAD